MLSIRYTLIRVLLLAGLAAPFAAVAAHPGHAKNDAPSRHGAPGCDIGSPPPPPFGAALTPGDAPLPPFLHGLKLSEEQRDRIFAIQYEQMPRLRENAKAARKAMEELRSLAFSGKFDDEKAKALAETGARALVETTLLHSRADQQMIALLSAEQRQQMADMKARLDAHFNRDFSPR